MLAFRTRENPSLWFIAGSRLPENPKCLLISTFRTFNPCFRKNIDLLLQNYSLSLLLFLDDH